MAIRKDSKVIKLSSSRGILGVDRKYMIIAIIIAIGIGLFLAFRPNAYKISMNGEFIGAIKDKRVIEGAKDTVITQLKSLYGTEVEFEEDLEIERYRAKKKDYIDQSYLISCMRSKMDILIGFKEIFVEGESVGIVASQADVETLKDELKKKYYGDKEIEVEFGKQVEVKDVFAKEEDLISMDKLVQKCSTTTPKSITYTVQPGDTLSGIASKYNTTIESIISANKGFSSQTVLQLGQVINANINEALLPLNIVESKNVVDTNAENTENAGDNHSTDNTQSENQKAESTS